MTTGELITLLQDFPENTPLSINFHRDVRRYGYAHRRTFEVEAPASGEDAAGNQIVPDTCNITVVIE